MPALSLIIPTHRRVAALTALLDSIVRQTLERGQYEVLIVDDGSPADDHAALAAVLARRFAELPITCWRQEQAGPARARNQALARARAPLVLILNDDVTLAPDHLAAHVAAHAAAPEEHVVFRGLTHWADDSPDTAVMRWMRANTFRYDWDLFHPVEAHFVHFHTCDLSMKASHARAFPYDEAFDVPCCEDTDVALRMLKAGRLDLRLLPAARSWHHHPHDLAAFRRRAVMGGRAFALLLDRHPELEYRLHGGHLRLCPQWRRRLRSLLALATGRRQRHLSLLHDWLMLREIIARRPPLSGDGGPYPQRLLDALPGGAKVTFSSTLPPHSAAPSTATPA